MISRMILEPRKWKWFLNGATLFFLLTAVLTMPCPGYGQTAGPLVLKGRIALSDVSGRIDHMSVDFARKRLFVAAVENHTVEVIDIQLRKRIHTIQGLPEPQGLYYDSSSNRLFVACGLDGTVRIFDATTFRPLSTVKFPDDADNIRYDPRHKHLIVGYAGAKQLRNRNTGSGGLGILDPSGRKLGNIIVDAHPESFQLDKQGERLYVNVPERKEIEVIDLANSAVVTHWPIASGENNFPMALDETHHRVFIACWNPPRLVVLDDAGGKEITNTEIAGKSDDIFYDRASGRIYVLTAQGALDVIQQKDADHYERIARYTTPAGTQTGLFVPQWGELFAATRKTGDQASEVLIYKAQ